jgi:hypothetical protein
MLRLKIKKHMNGQMPIRMVEDQDNINAVSSRIEMKSTAQSINFDAAKLHRKTIGRNA